jgi:RHS repeat-associated protein
LRHPKTPYLPKAQNGLLHYPFGMTMVGYKNEEFSYAFDFNGKETDSETGLQDYGFRIYNKSYGRFLSVDPLAKKYSWLSPFHFVGNTPTINIEVDGRYFIRNQRPSTSHPIRSKYKDMNWVVMLTDFDKMKELDRIASIPLIGLTAQIPRAVARTVDPSLNYTALEWTGFGIDVILSLSGYAAIKGAGELGKVILKFNREMVGLIINIVDDPEYAEILIDMEAARRLASKGIGTITYTDDGRKRNAIVRGLEINESVILEWKEEFQKEAGDKKLSEDKIDNLITQRIKKLMDDEKNKIKVEVNETMEKVDEEIKKEEEKKGNIK